MTTYDPDLHRDIVGANGESNRKFWPVNKFVILAAEAGLISLVKQDTEPGDTTKVWLDVEEPESANGIVKVYSSGSWIPMTPALFAEHIGAGGGGGGTWGSITGTLSSQTDLQTALNAKLDDSQASAFGLTLLDDADAATARTTLGLAIGADVQAWDAQLDSLSSASPNGVSLVTAANYAAMRALLDLEAGTDFYSIAAADAAFQPLDADLTAVAGLSSNGMVARTGAGTASVRTVTGTSNRITVTNGDGVSGNPTLDVGSDVAIATGDTYTGAHDFGGADSLELPNSAAPTVNADGEIALDTSVADFSHGVLKYYGGEELAVVALPVAELTAPTDGHVVAYNATNDEFELVAQSGGIGGSDWEWIFQNQTRNFATGTGWQTIFNDGTDSYGFLVEADTIYEFECQFTVTGMSGTSGNLKFGLTDLGNSLTFHICMFHVVGMDATTPTTAAAQGGSFHRVTNGQTAGNIVTAATGTAVSVTITGIFAVDIADDLIPVVSMTTSVGTAAISYGGAFFKLRKLLTDANVGDGNNVYKTTGWATV